MFYYLITLITLKGNRLHYVLDDAENLMYEGAVEFQGDETNGSAFGYNANGNLITDTGKGIMHIDYDDNNNPSRIQFANGNVTEYVYTATGEKLRAVHYTAVPNIEVGSGETHTLTDAEILFKDSTDYHGSLIMENGVPSQYLFDGGYCKLKDGSGNANISYHYYDRDHLGNIRGVIDEAGTVEQITNYYPFGAPYSDATTTNPTLQRYKYNGKELELMHGLKWYDYGARWYDPLLVNWNRPDPSHKDYYPWSPYVYCGDNPMNAVDPDGRKTGLPEEILFGLTHPLITLRIGIGVTKGAVNISTNATRFATRKEILFGSAKGQEDRGSENGAFRHALWQAEITSEFGSNIAKKIGDAHENNPFIDMNQTLFNYLDDADKSADLHNNIIGRTIGKENKGAGMKRIAIAVLNTFRDKGLYVAKGVKGGYKLDIVKLDLDKYEQLLKIFEQLDDNGRFDYEKLKPENEKIRRYEALQNALP